MLRLSKLTDYGIVILTYMAKNQDGLYSAIEIAKATGVAPPTVSKILKELLKAKVLISTRGAKGGYRLAKTAEKITVATVIIALEGPIALTECSVSEHNHSCEQVSSCEIGGVWGLINQTVFNALEAITLADMLVSVNRPAHPQEINIPISSLSRRLSSRV
jgi:FeS assembly SUF system regulator